MPKKTVTPRNFFEALSAVVDSKSKMLLTNVGTAPSLLSLSIDLNSILMDDENATTLLRPNFNLDKQIELDTDELDDDSWIKLLFSMGINTNKDDVYNSTSFSIFQNVKTDHPELIGMMESTLTGVKSEPVKEAPEEEEPRLDPDAQRSYAFDFGTPREALKGIGWKESQNVKSAESFTMKQYGAYMKEFERLRERLLDTKRLFSVFQGNSDGFNHMVESLDVLCKTAKKCSTASDFTNKDFQQALAKVVMACNEYQQSHTDPKGYLNNDYRKARLKTAAELELLADLLDKQADLNAPTTGVARLKLKYELARSLEGKKLPGNAASPEALSKGCNSPENAKRYAAYENTEPMVINSLLRRKSGDFWTLCSENKNRTSVKAEKPNPVKENTAQKKTDFAPKI